MHEPRRSRSKKARKLDRKHSRKSIKSDNLHVPLTPSTFRKIKTSASRPSTRSLINGLKSVGDRGPLVRLSHSRSSELPENIAVHFSSFYKTEDRGRPAHSAEEKPSGFEARSFPKMEFTRQMVYKLENSAGTQSYGKQVSAVLEDTVESPGFDLKLPPADNCEPFIKPDDYYPLWYRDPNKIPQISGEKFQEIKAKYQSKEVGEGMRKAEESISDYAETDAEIETETDSEEDGYRCEDHSGFSRLLQGTKINLPAKSSRLITSTENKDSENPRFNIKAESTPGISSSDHCSCSCSETSCESGAKDDEEESLDWETEEEDKVEVRIADNFRKILGLDQA